MGTYVPGATLSNVRAVTDYLIDELQGCAVEQGMIICVNCRMEVISTAVVGVGDLGSVSMSPANVAKVALLSNAHSIFLAHNHPGGTCRPSQEDIYATKQIADSLKIFGIRVLDHIIVCSTGDTYSMCQHGDLY